MSVSIAKDSRAYYCREPPFHPEERYPEYEFEESGGENPGYRCVREALYRMGMDSRNYGKGSWNPMGDIIRPGDRVLIKPNFVLHQNLAGGIESLITHGSVIRSALDYVHKALMGKGSIIIGDAPQQTADFDAIVKSTGLGSIIDFYDAKGTVKVSAVDLRKQRGYPRKMGGLKRVDLSGDPYGYTAVDLKCDSELCDASADYGRFRIADYHRDEVFKHHNDRKNEYYIPNSVLSADVIINLPKLKCHGKTGITCALKNMVGINGYKDWLPHHRAGSHDEGGDEYPAKDMRKYLFCRLDERMNSTDNPFKLVPLRMASLLTYFSKVIVPFRDECFQGSWHGNDTIPRTIADLNKIVFYADRHGSMKKASQRKMLVLVDAVIAGEKDGPLKPLPKECGMIVAGDSPVEVDLVCSQIMGFDPARILTFKYAMNSRKYSLFRGSPRDIMVNAEGCAGFKDVYGMYCCHFKPPSGWEGEIEIKCPGHAGSPEQNVVIKAG